MAQPGARIALVTGASRGIGRASALALAEVGYDLAITARTVHEGERFEHSPTLKASDTSALPGSLDTTAAEIRERGRRVLPIPMDLLERRSVHAAVDKTLADWGRIDLLVNNAIYTGPGTMDHFLDLPLDAVERIFQANVFSQLLLTQRVLPHMLERGSGIVINLVSGAGLSDPPAPAGEGGWGFAYGASKGAFHRLAGVLHVELADRGVRVHNLEPGYVITEAMQASGLVDQFADNIEALGGAPPRVPAAVIAWLASDPGAVEWDGKTVFAQKFCRDQGLLSDWP